MGNPVLDIPGKLGQQSHVDTSAAQPSESDALDMADGFVNGVLLGGLIWVVLVILPVLVYVFW